MVRLATVVLYGNIVRAKQRFWSKKIHFWWIEECKPCSDAYQWMFHDVFMFLKFTETLFCVSFGILFLYHFYIVSESFWIPFRRSFGIPFWHRFGTSFRHAHNVSLDMLCRMFWIRFLLPVLATIARIFRYTVWHILACIFGQQCFFARIHFLTCLIVYQFISSHLFL